jgi:hypothetical protein
VQYILFVANSNAKRDLLELYNKRFETSHKINKILEKHLILGYDSAEVWWVWTHDRKVMGSNLVSSKMALKPCQDLFQHPIRVQIKNE